MGLEKRYVATTEDSGDDRAEQPTMPPMPKVGSLRFKGSAPTVPPDEDDGTELQLDAVPSAEPSPLERILMAVAEPENLAAVVRYFEERDKREHETARLEQQQATELALEQERLNIELRRDLARLDATSNDKAGDASASFAMRALWSTVAFAALVLVAIAGSVIWGKMDGPTAVTALVALITTMPTVLGMLRDAVAGRRRKRRGHGAVGQDGDDDG